MANVIKTKKDLEEEKKKRKKKKTSVLDILKFLQASEVPEEEEVRATQSIPGPGAR